VCRGHCADRTQHANDSELSATPRPQHTNNSTERPHARPVTLRAAHSRSGCSPLIRRTALLLLPGCRPCRARPWNHFRAQHAGGGAKKRARCGAQGLAPCACGAQTASAAWPTNPLASLLPRSTPPRPLQPSGDKFVNLLSKLSNTVCTNCLPKRQWHSDVAGERSQAGHWHGGCGGGAQRLCVATACECTRALTNARHSLATPPW